MLLVWLPFIEEATAVTDCLLILVEETVCFPAQSKFLMVALKVKRAGHNTNFPIQVGLKLCRTRSKVRKFFI